MRLTVFERNTKTVDIQNIGFLKMKPENIFVYFNYSNFHFSILLVMISGKGKAYVSYGAYPCFFILMFSQCLKDYLDVIHLRSISTQRKKI